MKATADPATSVGDAEPLDAFGRFQRLARALFRVDKKDVPKHEPKKRDKLKADDPATTR